MFEPTFRFTESARVFELVFRVAFVGVFVVVAMFGVSFCWV
jgi:hypothetical protein